MGDRNGSGGRTRLTDLQQSRFSIIEILAKTSKIVYRFQIFVEVCIYTYRRISCQVSLYITVSRTHFDVTVTQQSGSDCHGSAIVPRVSELRSFRRYLTEVR